MPPSLSGARSLRRLTPLAEREASAEQRPEIACRPLLSAERSREQRAQGPFVFQQRTSRGRRLLVSGTAPPPRHPGGAPCVLVVNSGADGDVCRDREDDVPRVKVCHDEVVRGNPCEKAESKAPAFVAKGVPRREANYIPRARAALVSGWNKLSDMQRWAPESVAEYGKVRR